MYVLDLLKKVSFFVALAEDVLSTIPSLSQRMEYLRGQGYPVIGGGTGRVVFEKSPESVIKLAWNDAGIAQNKNELDTIKRYQNSGFVPLLFSAASDSSWLELENIKQLRYLNEFEKATNGIKWKDWLDALYALKNGYNLADVNVPNESEEIVKKSPRLGLDPLQVWQLVQRVKANPIFSQLLKFIESSGLVPDEFATGMDHFGTNTNGQLKLLDLGFTPEIIETYYDQERPQFSEVENPEWDFHVDPEQLRDTVY